MQQVKRGRPPKFFGAPCLTSPGIKPTLGQLKERSFLQTSVYSAAATSRMNAGRLLKGRPTLSVRPSERRLRPRHRLVVRAGILTATGPKFAAEEVLVKGTLGEGSYGQVFEVRSP